MSISFKKRGGVRVLWKCFVYPVISYLYFFSETVTAKTIVNLTPRDSNQVVPGEDTEVTYEGPDPKQLSALVQKSAFCYQPVKVDCVGQTVSFIIALLL